MDALITGSIVCGLLGICAGVIEGKELSREVRRMWSRLGCYRVVLRWRSPRRHSGTAKVIRYEQFHLRRVQAK